MIPTIARIPLSIAAALALAACAGLAAGAPARPGEPACPQAVVVAGIDRSGSYALRPAGLAQVAALVQARACPSSVWFVRAIGTDSFSDREIVFTVTVPEAHPACANPFDRRCREAARRRDAVIAAVKDEAARRLRALRLPVARLTDYWGFLAKASDLLAGAPAGADRYVLIAGDLVDDLGRRTRLNLTGVRVVVVAYQGGPRAEASAARLRAWERVVRAAGARVRGRRSRRAAGAGVGPLRRTVAAERVRRPAGSPLWR